MMFPTLKKSAAILLALAALHPFARAQIQVEMTLKRTLYLAYEPLIVNVSIQNLTGNSLNLRDTDAIPWFGFQIETLDGRPIAPHHSGHSNPPLLLKPGEKLTRPVNLTPLYPIGEFGGYRVRAQIHAMSIGQTFSSQPMNIEITEGRSIFEKTVGVPANQPGGGGMRKVTIMTHRLPNSTQLYLRITDPDAGVIKCTHRLGRLVSYGSPEILFDNQNQIHILQNVAPKAFLHSHIGLNGEVLERKTYQQIKKRPVLKSSVDGKVTVIGAQEIDNSVAEQEQITPSISDRPVPLPDSDTDLTPKDEKRPKNLLSR
ncbi:MAG: hypothetical protein ACO3GO_01190 [Terrimicrobiaceae bacterium]